MPGHDIIVMGASSGGIETFVEIVAELPRDLPAAVFVILHISPRSTTKLSGGTGAKKSTHQFSEDI